MQSIQRSRSLRSTHDMTPRRARSARLTLRAALPAGSTGSMHARAAGLKPARPACVVSNLCRPCGQHFDKAAATQERCPRDAAVCLLAITGRQTAPLRNQLLSFFISSASSQSARLIFTD